MALFVFPAWTNKARPLAALALGAAPVYAAVLLWYGLSPRTLDVGYAPPQPVEYSHALHAGELGIDCRYCHVSVERAAHPTVPPTQTCMNCHASVRVESPKFLAARTSYVNGESLAWTRVHRLPDFVYFDHSAHVAQGVGCVECHGRVDAMERVYQAQPLSMGWCLDCHRDPAPHLRPPEAVTKMDARDWLPPGQDARALGEKLLRERNVAPSTDCTTCHR